MKALSVKPVWGGLIREQLKDLEIRSRRTNYRGPLLICTSKRPAYGTVPCGAAICIVQLVGSRPMRPEDEDRAGCPYAPGLWAWELADVTLLEPFAVTGSLGFFEIEDARIDAARLRAARTPRPLCA